MSRLRKVLPILSLASHTPSITLAPDLAWSPAGTHDLLAELESLYWEGVKAELENIVRTLKAWQQPECSDVSVSDEDDAHIHGFDTFLDQVSQEARAFAKRYGNLREKQLRGKIAGPLDRPPSDKTAFMEVVENQFAEYASSKIRSAVRKSIKSVPKLKGMEQRAWVLLQAAGFLDMEKLVEHRPPLDDVGFWKRPAIPQLALHGFSKDWRPSFQSLRCKGQDCNGIIRGSMFVSQDKSEPSVVCEECYRAHYYGKENYTKTYKHCVLAESITPEISRDMCHCTGVPHEDEKGQPLSLFPVSKKAFHLKHTIPPCNLVDLGDQVALAKYQGLQTALGGKEKIEKQRRELTKVELPNAKKSKSDELRKMIGRGRANSRSASSSTTSVVEPQADEDIPLLFRRYTERYPYGNVHMALRVGPLVIENGVSHTKGGALVSVREMPIFHERFHLQTLPQRDLAVDGGSDRRLWQRKRHVNAPKRYKAMMKQVVGAPFTGVLPHDEELQIVKDTIAASRLPFDDPGLPTADQIEMLSSGLQPALEKLKVLLESRVKKYLGSIVERLLDKNVALAWSATHNNCQTFCDSLIDQSLFKPLLNGPATGLDPGVYPLYNMSFMCPDEGYRQRGVRTKYDVPFGLTEEYLLRFHFGRHDDADMIDTYQEYWYDWGAFGGTLYKYQDLFPWDCTEAYERYPTKCGGCNLAKHVWAFPFDSWSMASLHLSRDRHMYAPATTDKDMTAVGEGASTSSWMRNRLTVLSATSILNRAATAMAGTKELRKATAWLHDSELRPDLDPSLIRVKLGGIHRAQPFSHHFEAGTYKHFFVAPWTTRPRDEQIEQYESLRDQRAAMADVQVRVYNSRYPLSTTPEETPYRGFEGLWVLEDNTGEECMWKSDNGNAKCIKEEVSCKNVPMDDIKPNDRFSDSHITPTGVKPPIVTCGGGCGSSSPRAADCASAETIKAAAAQKHRITPTRVAEEERLLAVEEE
ncbi:hypothetical protein CDV31_006170, partial [Fusarium ambrosium]